MRKAEKSVEDVKTKLEKTVLQKGETMTAIGFATGRNIRAGNLTHFYAKDSTLSECSYNTIMQICRYLKCSPEDILEENEINGVYSDIRSMRNFIKLIKSASHKTSNKKGVTNYFQAFYRRSNLIFSWITEYPSGRVSFRCGQFKVQNNLIDEGNCYEMTFNSDLSDISNLYTLHQGVKILTPVLFEKASNSDIVEGGLEIDSSPQKNSQNNEDTQEGVLKSDSSPFSKEEKEEVRAEGGIKNDSSSNTKEGGYEFDSSPKTKTPARDFTFEELREGVLKSDSSPIIMRRKGLFAALDRLKLQALPYDDLSGRFLEFLKDLYEQEKGFEELDHSDFMRSINPILSPFKNNSMRKTLQEQYKNQE